MLKFCVCLVALFHFFILYAEEKTLIRVGHFATITHAQAVIAHGMSRQEKGWFEQYFGPDVEIQWFVYNAGPSAMEALFADSIDLVYVGPSPTINAYIKAKGKIIRVVCGACSGGASLVVQPNKIRSIEDFKGKKVATPQLGNTQDVVARAWFYLNGFKFNLFGGDVTIIPMENVDQYTLFQQGDLDAAWTVEPWVSRLVLEANGQVFLNESTLRASTGGKYTTAHLVSSESFLNKHPALVKKWILAQLELTDWIRNNEEAAKSLFNDELKKETFRNLSRAIIDRAWQQIELTDEPIQASVTQDADWAYQIGFLKEKPDLSALYDLRFLREVLSERTSLKKGKKNGR